tara:strand:- start:69 stop:308 length:240 start_codon:yes stop_codon:yes gene_type:complete
MLSFWIKLIFFIFVFNLFITENLYAYVGLGPLIPIIGNLIIYIFLALVAILGIIVYPLKSIINKFKNKKKNTSNLKNKV